VEHHALSPRPWRAAALVAAAIATIELFVLIIIGIAVGARFLVTETNGAAAAPLAVRDQPATTAATGEPTAAKSAAPLTRRETSVLVLNGNGVSGAAAAAADRVRRFDYLIAGTGDAPRTDFRRSLVMYRSGFEGEARRLAADLKLKRVIPLDGLRVRDLQGAHVALILGR
jgi:hypothetical protein